MLSLLFVSRHVPSSQFTVHAMATPLAGCSATAIATSKRSDRFTLQQRSSPHGR
jgi:hypothetical protein